MGVGIPFSLTMDPSFVPQVTGRAFFPSVRPISQIPFPEFADCPALLRVARSL